MTDNIFRPHYSITDSIPWALEAIERQSWLIENMLLMPKHEAWLRREVKVGRASATTRIEGAEMDEAAVGKLLNRRSGSKLTDDERANINAIDAYEFIDFVSDQTDIPIDELAIRQLNRYFMSGFAEALTPGVYRRGENRIGSYAPPNQGDVPGLMQSFALWLREDSGLHPVLKSGIAHIHMVAVHPFWDGNGRTARGLATLLLQRSGFGFKKLLSLEAGLFGVRSEYFAAIERTLGAEFSPEYDAASWLEFYTLAVKADADRLTAGLTDWRRMMDDLYAGGQEVGLSPRQMDGRMYAVRAGEMTRSDYIDVTGTSPGTASRDLANLVARGLLVAEGKTRSRVYYPARPKSEAGTNQGGEQLSPIEGGAD